MRTKHSRLEWAFALGLAALGVAYLGGADNQASAQKSSAQPSEGKPKLRVHILATGGTIAGAQESQTDVGYKSGTFKVQDLIDAVPAMKDLATITGEQVVNIGSQDMNDKVWLTLAKRANEVLSSGDVDAIVITHGTDTMEETAMFLNLVVRSEKPVVLVGSMRPATAVSADGPGNLFNAVAVAVDRRAAKRGVLVVMNDEVHAARDVEKMDTTSVQTFASPMRGPQGMVHSGNIAWFEPSNKRHTYRSEFDVSKLGRLPRVDIIYAHANMPPDLIDSAVKNGAKGIVVAGVGDGNMTKEALATLEKAAKEKGILVVRSSRLATGIVLRNSEVDDDKMGFVASGEFNPGKSRVLAQMALTQSSDPVRAQKIFQTY